MRRETDSFTDASLSLDFAKDRFGPYTNAAVEVDYVHFVQFDPWPATLYSFLISALLVAIPTPPIMQVITFSVLIPITTVVVLMWLMHTHRFGGRGRIAKVGHVPAFSSRFWNCRGERHLRPAG